MIIVNDYIDDIFNDFKEYLDNQENLCELKEEAYFYSNHIPNYDKLCVQQLYLLRYAYAYIYMSIWKCIHIYLIIFIKIKLIIVGGEYYLLERALV